ncbi:MAG TPA: hypothetical protein VHZ51_31720 [Ktedonobacteraceae bacterium]|jgi:hypothetical protein|nr:hypothetical protein [Ktedonobacteraceae bacterium]
MTKKDTIINIRKLAALDLVFHGPKFILAEFALAVILCAAFGIFSLFVSFRTPSHPALSIIIGLVLSWLAISYVPLLLYAVDIVKRKSAQQEVAFELEHRDFYARKYTLQSFLIALPLVVPILTIVQEMQKRSYADRN